MADPPAISSVAPAVVDPSGGTLVRVVGRGFVGGDSPSRVLFGDVEGDVLGIGMDPSRLIVVAPRHDVGVVEMTVVNPDGQASAAGYPFLFVSDLASPCGADGAAILVAVLGFRPVLGRRRRRPG